MEYYITIEESTTFYRPVLELFNDGEIHRNKDIIEEIRKILSEDEKDSDKVKQWVTRPIQHFNQAGCLKKVGRGCHQITEDGIKLLNTNEESLDRKILKKFCPKYNEKIKNSRSDLVMKEKDYTWINFYMEFADKLLEYKDNQEELISKIVKTYDKIGIKMPTLERDENERSIIPYEIDPFTVFAFFNKGITNENRMKIINGIKEEFSILSDVPQEFPGIPVVNNMKATFYYFSRGRQKDDIPNLWKVFESAMKLTKNNSPENRQDFIKYYDRVIKQKGIRWNITMALYWIRPYDFINLDGKNRSFLSNPNIFSEEISNEAKNLKNPPEGEDYLKLCTLCKDYLDKTEFNNFAELSAAAYVDQEDTDTEDDTGETSQYLEYSIEEFLNEVYINEKDYFTVVNLLKNKKNLIIQGAPGVGKTFMAKRLAYSLIGETNFDRVMMVQFHQSYSYEDFIMGFRPTKEGFELKNGTFYKFCKKAELDNENDYFFIIDEINRGNLSKIFGELFMLIESDKRGEDNKIQLLYSDELFCIPENVYIIGLMNTADRSLAMIDYALRRRFAFFDLKPGFQSRGFKEYQEKINDSQFDDLIKVIEQLNDDIKNDDSLGEGFRIGHSFFCDLSLDDLEEKMKFIVEYEIIPLIKEYWFDEEDKINEWSDKLREVVN